MGKSGNRASGQPEYVTISERHLTCRMATNNKENVVKFNVAKSKTFSYLNAYYPPKGIIILKSQYFQRKY